MGHDLHRAALVACCVLAIVVAAAFFPAAGYGDFPGRDAVSDDHYIESGTGIDPGTDEADDSVGEDDREDHDGDDQQDDSSDESDDTDSTDDQQDDNDDASDESEDTDSTDDQQDDSDDASDDDESSSTAESGDGLGISLGNVVAALLMLVFFVPFALLWRATDPARHPHLSEADIPDGFLPRLQFRLKRIPQVTMAATIGASSVVPTVADALVRTGRGVGSGFGQLGRSIGRGFASAIVAAPAGFASALQGFGGLSLTSGFSALVGGLGDLRPTGGRSSAGRSTTTSATGGSNTDQATDSGEDPGPQTIEAAWEEMTALVSRSSRSPDSKTPGEYARAAIAAGYPKSAVSTLTEVFRQVRYGDYPPTDDRTHRARAAYEELLDAVDDDGDDR